ncbi:MAG TPA: hypothetical protein VNA25_22225 [Phycisphaerae bacterium]|nr:hypothetical protein [Phycisphaerae bacterium]
MTEREQLPGEEVREGIATSRHDFARFFYWCEGWQTVATGYKRAADLVLDAMLTESTEIDELVFPVLFLYRHWLELSIKDCLDLSRLAGRMTEEDFKNQLDHRLEGHLRSLRGAFEDEEMQVAIGRGEERHNLSESFAVLETWMRRFSEFDPGSFRCRYPIAKDGKQHPFPSLEDGLGGTSVAALRREMDNLEAAIGDISSALTAEIDHRQTNSRRQ